MAFEDPSSTVIRSWILYPILRISEQGASTRLCGRSSRDNRSADPSSLAIEASGRKALLESANAIAASHFLARTTTLSAARPVGGSPADNVRADASDNGSFASVILSRGGPAPLRKPEDRRRGARRLASPP